MTLLPRKTRLHELQATYEDAIGTKQFRYASGTKRRSSQNSRTECHSEGMLSALFPPRMIPTLWYLKVIPAARHQIARHPHMACTRGTQNTKEKFHATLVGYLPRHRSSPQACSIALSALLNVSTSFAVSSSPTLNLIKSASTPHCAHCKHGNVSYFCHCDHGTFPL